MSKTPVPSWQVESQCLGKHRFESAAMAKQIAAQTARRKDCSTVAYLCPACNGWHIGNTRHHRKI